MDSPVILGSDRSPTAQETLAELRTVAATAPGSASAWTWFASPLAAWLAVIAQVASPPIVCAGWQTFSTANGLAGNQVLCMAADREGTLWFGANGYLSRYDGATWTTFGPHELPGVVLSLFEDRSERLWIGTNGGLARSDDPGHMHMRPVASWRVEDIAEGPDGRVWFVNSFGLLVYDGESWVEHPVSDDLRWSIPQRISVDDMGVVWIGTLNEGLERFDGTSWSRVDSPDGPGRVPVFDVWHARGDTVWFATGSGAYRYAGGAWTRYGREQGMASDEIRGITGDGFGNIWFARYGMSRLRGDVITNFGYADGLPEGYSSVLVDRSGNVWFAGDGAIRFDQTRLKVFGPADGLLSQYTHVVLSPPRGIPWAMIEGGGAARFDGRTWRVFTTADGLAGNQVADVFQDRSGFFWFSTREGVTRWDSASDYWQSFDTSHGLGSNWTWWVYQDRPGRIWALTREGISLYLGDAWRTYTRADSFAGARFASGWGHDIQEDADGTLWVATWAGLSRFDGTSWRTFGLADGLPDTVVNSVTRDRDGILWAATDKGLARFDGSTWQTLGKKDGLASDFTWDLLVHSSGDLWVVNAPGVSRLHGSTWTNYSSSDGLADDHVSGLLTEDGAGNVWVPTDHGASWFDGERWRSYSRGEGLPADGVTWWVVEDRQGGIWFSSDRGVALLEPDRVPPRAVIVSRPPNAFASRSAELYAVAAFGEPSVEFSFVLDGAAWSPWSINSSWSGSGLVDGAHRLEVRVRDRVGNVSPPTKAVFEIDATPPVGLLESPVNAGILKGSLAVRGTAADPRFKDYRVQIRPAGATSWDNATLLTESSAPVSGGLLATWDTSLLPDGNYELRLAVSDTLGLTGTTQVTVIVDNHAPFAEQTAPARVSAISGGDIYTTNQELHLYFPPHGFDQDAVVSIVPEAAPDAFPSGATRVLPGYEISWSAASLVKPATLAFSTAGRASAPGTLAIYFSSDGNAWQRLGGTVAEEQVSLAVRETGRYALYAETAVPSGDRRLSALSFTPRVFSPAGTFANREVGISFTLGRASSVTVRVYNRAGRLVREVASGDPMGPGANLVRWDGRDREGSVVTDGLYLVTVEALGQTRTQTLAVVR
ncbi:MAG TPA: two-component regulator propeller domain-containing protein [Candidatus Eisenbacteria bacterium]|jgi:ligand-binding sensor domain-containing protein